MLLLFSGGMYYSQNVGINTTNPEEKLHINGGFRTNELKLQAPFQKLTASENYSFLVKAPSPNNKITSATSLFDLQNAPAPLNFIQYKITAYSGDRDWINKYNTKINASKYVVVISSFGYNLSVYLQGNSATNPETPVPQIYAFEEGGTWRLKADYDGFKPYVTTSTPQGVWTLNLVVFDKAYATTKSHTINLNGQTSGSANNHLTNN